MSLARIDRATGRVMVEVLLTGPRSDAFGKFLLDTGCPVTSVDPELIDTAGYSVRQGKRHSRLIGPGEGASLGWVLTVDAFEAFGMRHSAFDVHVHDQPRELGIDGLLGMDWLLHHVLTFDGPEEFVELVR
jgi:hypothetical protein